MLPLLSWVMQRMLLLNNPCAAEYFPQLDLLSIEHTPLPRMAIHLVFSRSINTAVTSSPGSMLLPDRTVSHSPLRVRTLKPLRVAIQIAP